MILKKGDILVGEKRGRKEAWHPVVYIGGSIKEPLAVVMTHSGSFPCNTPLSGEYPNEKGVIKPSFFITHLIQKIEDWGPYTKKIGELSARDIELVESHIAGLTYITYSEYEEYTNKGRDCPKHGTFIGVREGRNNTPQRKKAL